MDLYEMLRVPRTADDAEIHNAYLRRKTELETGNAPELSPGEVRKQLSDIEYARKVLSDPVQRAEYDRALAADETLNRTAPRSVHKVSLAKPQLKKEQEFIPPATTPQAQSVPENTAQPPSADTGAAAKTAAGYFIANAAAFAVLVVMMIIFL